MINKVLTRIFLTGLICISFTLQSDAQSTQTSGRNNAALAATPGKSFQQQQGPYKLTSSLQLFDDGSNKGYLVVKVDIAQGSHIYSMKQKKPLKPTEIKVATTNSFRMLGSFAADKPAKVIEHDPIFEQRIEKHEGTVQFYAPIELTQGVDAKKVQATVVLNGQVCSDVGCLPINDVKSIASFSGYVKAPKGQAANGGQGVQTNRR